MISIPRCFQTWTSEACYVSIAQIRIIEPRGFLSIEDETGLVNAVVTAKIWVAQPSRTRHAGALILYGTLDSRDSRDGSLNILVGRLIPSPPGL